MEQATPSCSSQYSAIFIHSDNKTVKSRENLGSEHYSIPINFITSEIKFYHFFSSSVTLLLISHQISDYYLVWSADSLLLKQDTKS